MTDAEKFAVRLKESGGYETAPDHRPGILDRLFGWSDSWYYLRLIGIVSSGNLKIRFGKFGDVGWNSRALWTLRAIEGCGGRVHVMDVHHMMQLKGPAVYVANHMSLIETMLLPGLFILPYHTVTPVVKKSLTTYPVFGLIMRDIGCIAVGRKNPREDLKRVLEEGVAMLKTGRSVMLFPQSTRMLEFDPSRFNSLGVKLARKAGVPVVPVALRTDFQGVGRRLRDFGPVDRSRPLYFKFGAPMAVEGSGRETHQKVADFISASLREWGVKVLDAAPAAGDSDL